MKSGLVVLVWLMMAGGELLVAREGFPERRPEEAPLKLIGNGALVVGVLPDVGGRVVALRTHDGENLLDGRPDEWTELPEGHPNPPHDLRWKQNRGQVVWLGPQAEFWEHQVVRPEKKGSGWPPDPTITQAAYEVLEHEPDRIVLESPPSEVWGVVVRKTIVAQPDGKILFEAEARNVTDAVLPKGLWFNFRARPDARVFVPVRDGRDVRIENPVGVVGEVVDGLFGLKIDPGHAGKASGKAFVDPSAGVIVAKFAEGCLVLRFDETSTEEVAPGQAPVEIFRSRDAAGDELLELEQHAPLVELEPGGTMRHSETWELLPRDEGNALLESLRGAE